MKYLVMAIVTLVAANCAVAYAFEVPLPDLEGSYSSSDSERSVVVDFGGSINEISSMLLVLSGTIHSGWYEWFGGTMVWGGFVAVQFAEPNPGVMWAGTIDELNGPFVGTYDFYSRFGGTWDFLLDGVGVLTFGFHPSALMAEPDVWGPEPTCTIESAKLIVTGGAVSLEPNSWSGVKALYRTTGK